MTERNFSKPDYAHWVKMDYLDYYEAAMIVCGFEPAPDLSGFGRASDVINMPPEAERIYNILIRAQDQIFDRKNLVVVGMPFFEWARNKGIVFPPDLEKQLTKINTKTTDFLKENELLKTEIGQLRQEYMALQSQIKTSENKSATTRINKSFMIILGALAQEHYQYDPNRNNSTVSKIKSHIQACGLNMDEQTIKDRLYESLSYIKEESKK